MISKDRLVVVIRSAGERTETACRNLVLREVSEDQVHLVRMVPFEAALAESYRIGIQSGATWLMTLDADVLLRENAIGDFLAEAEAMSDRFFHTEGLVYDFLTGMYRKAGHRMYRVAMLNKALSLIPETGEAIRPEFTTINRMIAAGFPVQETGTVYGIHDFEQYYRDVYRKCVVHAVKHVAWLPELITRWKGMQHSELDFKIAMKAVIDGLLSEKEVSIDVRKFGDAASRAILETGLQEKRELDPETTSATAIGRILEDAGSIPDELKGIRSTGITVTRGDFLRKMRTEHGFWKTGIYVFGQLVMKAGVTITKKSGLSDDTL
jgi:hypothetical protein